LARTTPEGEGGDGDGGGVAASDAIDGAALRALASELSPSIASFLSALNFVSNALAFAHRHALLGRADLSGMLGRRLFGAHPIPDAAISSGSAVLGSGGGPGSVVGAAAHGLENGDDMPLMYELVRCMRRCCIPRGRSPGVWRIIQRAEPRLVAEVAAFERKLVGLGMLKDPSESDGAVGVAGAMPAKSRSAASLSPTGLSVFTNNDDGVGHSPSDPMSNPNKAKILSPLSELATSLRQAYVEGQRSQILIRGRSILLDTDYHNTVEVGTFVPEPSDAGTLASLDDDPLSAFALHRCSVSATARRIMELCRETLDDAANPEVASDYVDDALPPTLYRASRELMDLFRAIIPTAHAREIGTIPRVAAVLHNDCVYLAHECSLLGKWGMIWLYCAVPKLSSRMLNFFRSLFFASRCRV
jgi:centromere/kinetochore protein ZW10